MRLLTCEQPVLILHPVTGEKLCVPCGKCSACLNRRAYNWQKRIEAETASNKYAVFFELDYNEKNVPKLIKRNDCFVNLKLKAPLVIPFSKTKDWSLDDYRFISEQKYIKTLSLEDMQKFIKRLRINITRESSDKGIKNPSIRYYYCGEYGPTTFRPHYHFVLWHNDDALQRHMYYFLHKSWSLGRVRALKPVHDHAAGYVARYITCTTGLPRILQLPRVRPFAQSSRRCPIGTLPPYSEEVRQMFFAGTYYRTVENVKSGKVSRVPLSQYYQNTLFPRVPLFGFIPRRLLVSIYDYPTRFGSFREFYENVMSVALSGLSTGEFSYVDTSTGEIISTPTFDSGLTEYAYYLYYSALHRQERKYGTYFDVDKYPWHVLRYWWSVSNRVFSLRHVYGITLEDYVNRIVEFYNSKNYEQLKDQLEFEQEYASSRPLSHLLSIDPLFVDSLKRKDVLDEKDLLILSTYGVTPDVHAVFDLVDPATGVSFTDVSELDIIEDDPLSQPVVHLRQRFDARGRPRYPAEAIVHPEERLHLRTYSVSPSSLDDYEYDIYNTVDYRLFVENNDYVRKTNTKTKLNRDFLDRLAMSGDPRYEWLFNYRANVMSSSLDFADREYFKRLHKVYHSNLDSKKFVQKDLFDV